MAFNTFLIKENELMFAGIKSLVVDLLFFEKQMHLWHLQTNTYNIHNVLGEFYEGLADLIDKLAESTISVSGPIVADTERQYTFTNYNKSNLVPVIESLKVVINEMFVDTANIASVNSALASLAESFESTLYKLKELT